MSSKTIQPSGSLTDLAGKIPAEALVKAVDLIATITLGGFQMAAERQKFERELELLRHNDVNVRERLVMLVQLVDHAKITDAARDRVVSTICDLALK